MHLLKKFAIANNLKLKRFFRLSTVVFLLAEGMLLGVVACVGLVAAMHYILGLWFLALLFMLTALAFSFGVALFHRAVW